MFYTSRMVGTMLLLVAWVAPGVAQAYIGPGAGISAIGSLLALLGAVVLAIVGFVWYPLKRIMKNRRKARFEAAEKNDDNEPSS